MQTPQIDITQAGQVALGIILALLVAERIITLITPFIQKKNGKAHSCIPEGVDLLAIQTKIDTLYDWHNCKDDDGVFIWYTRRSLYEALNRLAQILDRLADDQRDIKRELCSLSDAVHDKD